MEDNMAEKSKQSEELAALKKQCEDCCKQLAALKKEVAALKKAKSSGGGADPRVDKILEALKASPKILRAYQG
tara:strand:+ start:451 stop:669 length:219 start_codon:yes stop_codon:yes gene_type:complete